MAEPLTIFFTLRDTREVSDALNELEERFADEVGYWGVPGSTSKVNYIKTELLVEEELYELLTAKELYEFLGFEPDWVVEHYEV